MTALQPGACDTTFLRTVLSSDFRTMKRECSSSALEAGQGRTTSTRALSAFAATRASTFQYAFLTELKHLVAAHLLFCYWEDFVLLQIFDASTQTLFLLTELKHVVVAYPFVSETTHHLLLLKKNLFVIANLCCKLIRPFFPSRFFWSNNHVMHAASRI